MLERAAVLHHQALLAEWADWLRRKRYAPLTVYGYLRIASRFLAAYETVPIEVFTPEHVERWLDGRRLGNVTYGTQLETLRAFFNWCRRSKRLLRSNPCAGVDKPPARRPDRPSLLPHQFDALCRAAGRLEQLAALHLLYYSGLRINELRHVKVGDVDLQRRLLRVRMGKGSRRSGPRERWTVIHKDTLPVLKLHLWRAIKLHPDVYLFGNGRRPPSAQGVREWFNRLRAKAGLPEDVTPHSLRHGFVRLMKLRGVPLDTAANLAGHDSLETTRRIYGRLTPEEQRQVYDRAMENYLDIS